MNLQSGDIIGSCRVIRPLGEGGMGAMYEVGHEKLGVRSALKTYTLADDLTEFTAALLFERGLSPRTAEAYGNDLRLFVEYSRAHGKTEASALTRADIDGFLSAERTRGLEGSTRSRRTVAIRRFFGWLRETRRIPSNPTDLVRLPRRERHLPRVLTEREVSELIENVKGTEPRDLRDRAMLEILYGCGLRVSELCAFRTDDLIAEGELIRIFGKGSKERVVPIGTCAGQALSRYLESARLAFARGENVDPHVFLTRLGRPFTRQGVFKIIRARAAEVGIAAERISPHVLRHCFASHMLAHGADIRAIQELLGHADIGTTQIYTHVDSTRFGAIHRKCHPRA